MKSRNKPAVTIYEIAEHVGVSPAAVSSTLSNRHVERRLSAQTVQKIREAAVKLGYVPNMAGRQLRAHKSATRRFDLAILTSFEAPLPLVGQALRSLQHRVDQETDKYTNYAVAIEMFHAGRLSEKIGLLEASRYHGVIITNTLPDDDQFLIKTKLPYHVIILGRRILNYHCVLEAPDYVGRNSAEILIDAGSKTPAILHSRMLTQTTANRVDAFEKTVKERLGCEPRKIISEDLQPEHGAAAMTDFLKSRKTLDGLFTVTDSMAVGAYRALHQSGRRIPEDVPVVGVGDFELAEFFAPPLTTVAGANEAMVAEAVPLLFRLLKGKKQTPSEVLVVPPVYVRESTRRQ